MLIDLNKQIEKSQNVLAATSSNSLSVVEDDQLCADRNINTKAVNDSDENIYYIKKLLRIW